MRKGEISMDRKVVGILKAGRGALHWSQENLAQESGVSIATIRRFESRINSITEMALQSLGRKMTVPVRREKVEAILNAFHRNGISLERDESAYKLSIRSDEDNYEFDDLVNEITSKSKRRNQA